MGFRISKITVSNYSLHFSLLTIFLQFYDSVITITKILISVPLSININNFNIGDNKISWDRKQMNKLMHNALRGELTSTFRRIYMGWLFWILDTYQTRFYHHRIQKSSLKFTPLIVSFDRRADFDFFTIFYRRTKIQLKISPEIQKLEF